MLHLGRAHTGGGDSVVYFPDLKVVLTSDVARATDLVRTGVPADRLLAQIKTDDIGWAPRIPQVDAFYNELSKAKR